VAVGTLTRHVPLQVPCNRTVPGYVMPTVPIPARQRGHDGTEKLSFLRGRAHTDRRGGQAHRIASAHNLLLRGVGLITLSERSQGGFRLYTEPDVARLRLAKRMKPLGFQLDEMRELIGMLHPRPTAPRGRNPGKREIERLRE
jgi:hypothetical protein